MAVFNSHTDADRNPTIQASFEIAIKDFRTSREPLLESIKIKHRRGNESYEIVFFAKVFPCDVKNETEWLGIRPYVRVYNEFDEAQDYDAFYCTVSVFNINGSLQYSENFEVSPYYKTVKSHKYLKRSLILDREAELLINGNLFVVFNFSLDLNSVAPLFHNELFHADMIEFLHSKHQTYCPENINILVFDFTSQIFHKSGKKHNVDEIYPEMRSLLSEPKASADNLEHIRLFDTRPHRFILSLDEQHNSVGTRLLKASPVISRLTKQQQAVVPLNIKSMTFINILYILEKGLFRAYTFDELLDIYEVSRYYEMKELQQKCGEKMLLSLMLPNEIKEVERLIDLNSDKTLSTLLDSYRLDYEDLVHILSWIPQALCTKSNEPGTACQNYIDSTDSSKTFAVFDFTFQILNLPQFHESRKKFGVYGFQPAVLSKSLEFYQGNGHSLEDVWIFDTRPHRFLLSLDDRRDGVGTRLLKASPVIKQYVDSSIMEERDKRIEISYLSSTAFLNVLHFLKWNTFCVSEFNVFLNMYEFSHDFKLKELRQRCAEKMILSIKFSNELEEVKRLADLYSDEYLSTLLDFCENEDAYSFKFLCWAPQGHCTNNNADQNYINTSDSKQTFKVLDFTFKILNLPQFHESRKKFGVYGLQPILSPHDSESIGDNRDDLEHVWIFDTQTSRFLLSLDEQQDSVGARLLAASPVLRRMVNTPMKEQREKHVAFPNLRGCTFINVLRYLKQKKFGSLSFSDFLDIYEMAHIYQMREVLKACAEKMIETINSPSELRCLERVVSLYPDRYLSTMFDSIRLDSQDLTTFLSSIPQADCVQDNVETEDTNDVFTESPRKTLTVFDFSLHILTLPLFHEARQRFGVFGIPPVPSPVQSEPKECSSDILRDIWMVDTQTDRFLLSFDERQNGVGVEFLKSSPVFSIMVEKDMKENQRRRIIIEHVKSQTFINVLYFLRNKKIPTTKFCEILEIYRMSHMYMTEELQRECSEKMVESIELRPDYEELKEIADLHSDEYLLNMLNTRRETFENMEQPEWSPYFDFYT